MASAASTGSPASRAVTPGGRVEPRAHHVDHLLLLVERHQPDPERERRRLAVGGDHRLREVRRHGVQQRRGCSPASWPTPAVRNRSVSDSAGHSVGLAAAVLGRVAVALEQPGLVVAHPRDDLRVGEVLALHDDVDLARDAGRLLQRVEVAHAPAGPAARARAGRSRPWSASRAPSPAQREHEPDQQHALRPLERAAQRRLARPARRAAAAARAGATRARRARRPARPRRAPRRRAARRRRAVARSRASAAVPALSARKNAIAMPTTSSTPKPRTIGTGESSSTRKPTPVASAAVAIVGTAMRAVAHRASPSASSHPRLVLDRVVDPQAEQHRQHRDRGHRQRRAEQRHQPERDRHRAPARPPAAAAAAGCGTRSASTSAITSDRRPRAAAASSRSARRARSSTSTGAPVTV